MMPKKYIRRALVIMAGFLFGYIMVAFILWAPNPTGWDITHRSGFVVFSSIGIAFPMAWLMIMENSKRRKEER